jgi:phosphotriesterase-related protein
MASHMTGKVQTVLGPIDPSEMGVTLTHEHILIDLTCYYAEPEEASVRNYHEKPYTIDMLGKTNAIWYINTDNGQLFDEADATGAIGDYMLAGGGTVVDVTNYDIGRDPLALARISRATGLNIVMGAGHYVPKAHPADMDERSEDAIHERIVRDITEGAGDTGVKTGVIGELGNVWPTTENQLKVLRAAGRAHAETGAPVSIHPGHHPESHLRILDELDRAGCPPGHVIMGHLDWSIDEYETLGRIAQTGCFLQYDVFGFEASALEYLGGHMDPLSDAQRIEHLEFLIGSGYGDKILVAQDVCMKWFRASHGGKGYAHILENIVPRMRSRGWTGAQLDDMLINNPARALAFA